MKYIKWKKLYLYFLPIKKFLIIIILVISLKSCILFILNRKIFKA
jgi:hypothetical protein